MQDPGYVVKCSPAHSSLFEKRAPLLNHLDIELTERCDNACQHCYINLPVNDAGAKSRELNTEQWKSILSQAADLGALLIRFTGGEPLLRPDFEELYIFTRSLGMKVLLFTNARLVTPRLAELFARIPPLMKIEISVYGMHPASYDGISSKRGAFAEFHKGMELLSKHHVPFWLKFALLPANLDEIKEFESWAAKIPSMEPVYAPPLSLDLRTRRDSPSKNLLIEKLRFSPVQTVNLLARHPGYRRDMAQLSARFIGPPGNRLFACEAGQTGCVDAFGKYQVCMMLRHPDTVYDLARGTLREALTEVFPVYLDMKAENPDYLHRCARCFLKGLCEQCPAKSWSEHGTLDTPVEYLCQVAHAQARFLGLLNDQEFAWEVTDWRKRVDSLQQAAALSDGKMIAKP